jgi:hypothetical protein
MPLISLVQLILIEMQKGVTLKRAASTLSNDNHAPPLEGDCKHSRKQRCLLADLPFPGGSSAHLLIWQKMFVPRLICWAGAQIDPFGTNLQMEGEVMRIWKLTFPSITIEKATSESTSNHDMVLSVVSSTTASYLSTILMFLVQKCAQQLA